MDNFAKLPDSGRKAAFSEAANLRNVNPVIIEKDFWVCWTLKHLYEIQELAPYITFKGGTSLSKAFDLIERFSEDIDLTISKDTPGIKGSQNPLEHSISGKERERRLDELRSRTQGFVKEAILPKLYANIKKAFGHENNWKLELDNEDKDQQTLLFFFPKTLEYDRRAEVPNDVVSHNPERTFSKELFSTNGYIRPSVKLEFGARGDIVPSAKQTITSYTAEILPKLFKAPKCVIPTLNAERTFWEKVTILHAIHHGSKLRDRMSRHYYDTYMLLEKGIADLALNNLPLLEQVILNKSVFFKDNKASYETAKIGSLKLTPPEELITSLYKDYNSMQLMFIGDAPKFDDVLSQLSTLEKRINKLKK